MDFVLTVKFDLPVTQSNANLTLATFFAIFQIVGIKFWQHMLDNGERICPTSVRVVCWGIFG